MELEQTVETCRSRERESVFDAGKALIEIRDLKLYREDFQTFELYCEMRWGWSRQHAYRVCEATEFREGQLLLAATGEPAQIPENENQARRMRSGKSVATPRQLDSSQKSNKQNSSKSMVAKADKTIPVEFVKPPPLPMDLGCLMRTIDKALDRVLHRNDIPYETLRLLHHIACEVKSACHMLQGVLPGFEDVAARPKFKVPSVEEVQLYCARPEVNVCGSDAIWFHDHMEMQGWKNYGKPIVSWEACIRSWKRQGGIFPSQKVVNANGRLVPKGKTLAQQDIERMKANVERL